MKLSFQLSRKVETDDLRVTTFPIKWTDEDTISEVVEEPERVFAEEDLLPLNDDGQEDDEEDDDEDMEAGAGEDIDLNESFNERIEKALDDMEEKGEEKMEEEANVDVEMGEF